MYRALIKCTEGVGNQFVWVLTNNFLSLKMVDCQGTMRQVAKPNMKYENGG
jgi:hypothetical protein